MTLKEARIKSGLTVIAVARAINVSQQAVYQWESGETSPTIANLIKLAKLYGCKVDDLLDGMEKE